LWIKLYWSSGRHGLLRRIYGQILVVYAVRYGLGTWESILNQHTIVYIVKYGLGTEKSILNQYAIIKSWRYVAKLLPFVTVDS